MEEIAATSQSLTFFSFSPLPQGLIAATWNEKSILTSDYSAWEQLTRKAINQSRVYRFVSCPPTYTTHYFYLSTLLSLVS
jgi:hypothetical protein